MGQKSAEWVRISGFDKTVLMLWLALAVALTVRTVLRPASHTAFPVLAAGAVHWWADQPVYANYRPDLDYFRYPPFFALLLTPFAWLGLTAGGVLWNYVNLGAFACGLWQFRRDLLPQKWSPGRQAIFLTLATLGGLRSLWNGSSNALTVGVLLLGLAAMARGRHWRAAWWLGGSLLIKLTPLPIVLLLTALWPREVFGRLALVLALGGLAPFLSRPATIVLSQYGDMVVQMRETSTERWPGFRDAWTVWQVARSLTSGGTEPILPLEPLDSPVYKVLQLAMAGATLAWCLACQGRARERTWLVLVTLGMGSSWTLLFGPAVEHPTYIFLAPSLAWALLKPGFARGRVLIAAAALLVLGLGWGGLARRWQEDLPIVLMALPGGTALFVAWLIGYVGDWWLPGIACQNHVQGAHQKLGLRG